jgi:hypothetical protein
MNNLLITANVSLSHSLDAKAPLEFCSDMVTIEGADGFYCFDRLIFIFYDEASHAVFDDLGDRPAPERYDWCTTRHRFDHH